MPQFADIFTGGYSKPGVRADFIAAPATTTQKSFDALTTADVPATTEIADDSEKCMKADCDCGCDDKPKRPKLKSILQASRELLQATTKSAGEGVWRTIEGDQKVFIQDGEVRAGGPAGPVIGGKKPSTKPKPTKKPDPKPKPESKAKPTLADIAKKADSPEAFIASIPNDSLDFVFHQTGDKAAAAILKDGFKTGKELNVAEKRGAIYAAGNTVNDGVYARTGEDDAHAGQTAAKVPIDIRGLKLFDATKYGFLSEIGTKIVRGELDFLTEQGYDGAIQFLPDGGVWEVAIPKDTASQRRMTPEKIESAYQELRDESEPKQDSDQESKPKPTKKPDPKPKAKKQEAIPGSNIPKDAKPFATPSKAVTEQIGKAQEGWLQRHAEASGTTPEKLKTEWTAKVKEMTAKAKVYIRMPPEVVDLVLEEGRYKSQFETNSSFGGDVQIEGRSEFELHQFGVPADTPDNQRPVYGYASDQTPYSRAKYQPGTKVKIAGNHDSTATYGRVVVELKDSVKDRSSITFGDSMNASGETLPTPMRSPDYRSLDFSNYGDGKMKTPRPIQTGSVDATAKYDGQYTEVQVHYGATTNDIAKVWMDRPPSAKTQSLLKKRGIEWEVMK